MLPEVCDQRIGSQRAFSARANTLGKPTSNRLPQKALLEKQRKRWKRQKVIDDSQIEKRMTHLNRAVGHAGICEFEKLRPMRCRE